MPYPFLPRTHRWGGRRTSSTAVVRHFLAACPALGRELARPTDRQFDWLWERVRERGRGPA